MVLVSLVPLDGSPESCSQDGSNCNFKLAKVALCDAGFRLVKLNYLQGFHLNLNKRNPTNALNNNLLLLS